MLGRLGNRWTVLVVVALMERPMRFNELRREVLGISQQMLTRTLKGLERDGLVCREVRATVPPQVEYRLSPLGRSLAKPLLELTSWIVDHLTEIRSHERAYDDAEDAGRRTGSMVRA